MKQSKKPLGSGRASHTFVNPLCLPCYPVNTFDMYGDKGAQTDGGSEGTPPIGKGSPYSFWYDYMPSMPEIMQRFNKLWISSMNLQVEGPYRATADPVGLYYEGMWYLYATGNGCWSSSDFIHWTAHPVNIEYVAPDIAVRRGKFYLAGNSTDLYVSDSPTGPFQTIGAFSWNGQPLNPSNNDISLFVDDDDRMYLYWGMGPGIWGAELNPRQPNELLTEPVNLIQFHPENWWERYGASNQDWSNGFLEGSNMIKINGTYYLQYSCAGTEFDSYAMGCYKSSQGPLSGFVLQKNNPICRKNYGLYRGVGHAAVCKGPQDTLWMFETVTGNYGVERRLACDPAGIDENGDLCVNFHYDVPQYTPGTLSHPELGNGANLDNLTMGHQMWASSWSEGRLPMYGVDGSMLTWWQPRKEDPEPVFYVGLRGDYYIYSIRVMFKEVTKDLNLRGAFGYRVEVYDGLDAKTGQWKTILDKTRNQEDLIYFYDVLEKPVKALFTRLVLTKWPEGVTPGLVDYSLFGMSVDKPGAGEEILSIVRELPWQ